MKINKTIVSYTIFTKNINIVVSLTSTLFHDFTSKLICSLVDHFFKKILWFIISVLTVKLVYQQ